MSKIGNRKIKKEEIDGDKIILTLGDGGTTTINKKLYDLVKDRESNGDITDTVCHILAAKFLQELTDYDLEYYMVELIGTRMQTFVHNMREEAIGKAFDASSVRNIKLSKVVKV